MEDYIDSKGKRIEKGFYEYAGIVWYFAGKYIRGIPMFDNETSMDIPILSSNLAKKFNRLTEEKVKEIIKKTKGKINFLEEKLK